MFELKKLPVGPWPSNCYFVADEETKKAYLIDAGADAEKILKMAENYSIQKILLTHGHVDHVGALNEVQQALDVEVGIHPEDSSGFDVKVDFELVDGMEFSLGNGVIRVKASAGHTPGSVLFELRDGSQPLRIISGDAVFPGGPGKTASAQALRISLENLGKTVFSKPDDTVLYPGHGVETTVGTERAGFEELCKQPFAPDRFGDVSWQG